MRNIWLSFWHMVKLIRHDKMLLAAGIAPLLAGTAIHFFVPYLEEMLIHFTGHKAVLSPYYGLFDIFLSSITPVMYCFIAAMVILEEHDDHIDCYLFVTSLGQNGYFTSRILIPAAVSFVVTTALLLAFRLTNLSVTGTLDLSLTGALQGIIIALMIVTLSSNKLEGMAITKISTLTLAGAALPYFVSAPYCFLLSFLPSFWTGVAIRNNTLCYTLPSIVASGIWITLLKVKYTQKTS